MKVFISHKQEDSALAISVKNAFTQYGITSYLDLLDSKISGDGKELTEHIKENLNSCTDIIVVMSEETKKSWWVPFEIGMAAQVDMPTASFLKSEVELPDYLSYWPRLKTVSDIGKYITIRKITEMTFQDRYIYHSAESRQAIKTKAFYDALKRELR